MTIATQIKKQIEKMNSSKREDILNEECEAFSGGSWGQKIYEFVDGSELVIEEDDSITVR